jgi:hypothetical protein
MDMKGNGNMAIKEITIGFARTVNLGNYESARVEASVKFEIESDLTHALNEQIGKAQEELAILLKTTWTAQIDTIKGRAKQDRQT